MTLYMDLEKISLIAHGAIWQIYIGIPCMIPFLGFGVALGFYLGGIVASRFRPLFAAPVYLFTLAAIPAATVYFAWQLIFGSY